MKEDADLDIKQAIIEELIDEPGIDATKVNKGIVDLRGKVGTFYEKLTAEEAVYRVRGVKKVNNDITVEITADLQRTDAEITDAAKNALLWDSTVPDNNIKVEVENAWITLKGEVEWHYQKTNAENVVANLTGSRGITNSIKIKSNVETDNPEDRIRKAMSRYAAIDEDQIDVKVQGNRAVLNGLVSNWTERKQAERAAWSTPGILEVDNQISITMTR